MPSTNHLRAVALLTVSLMASGTFAQTGDDVISLCIAGERLAFSCHIETKIVSLCMAGEQGALTSLSYRYGVPGKIENEFVATNTNKNRFFANVLPASPGTLVTQVWFDRGNVRYLLTECDGGNCGQHAGLAVLRGDKVLMDRKCPYLGNGDSAWFASDLINFGDPLSRGDDRHLRSTTELLQVDENGFNDVDKIYRSKPHPDW